MIWYYINVARDKASDRHKRNTYDRRKHKMKRNINEVMAELASMIDMQEQIKAEVETLQDEVKAYMTEQGVDEVIADNGEKATWREVISNRFDSTAFKKDFLDIYKEYCKKTTSKRFTFNA